jgi:multiple sugar transport system permease protein
MLCVVVVAFPIYWLFLMAFKSADEVFAVPPVYYPSAPSLRSFRALFGSGNRSDMRTILNSLIVASSTTVIAMTLGTMCAYSIVRFRTGGRHFSSWILSHRMLPPIAIVFPLFLAFAFLGILDNFVSLIVVYVAFNLPFSIWMMREYIEDIPVAVEESALIDGCTYLQLLTRIVVPMARGGIFATSVFTFIFAWNEFAFALVLAGRNVMTYPIKLTTYFGQEQAFWNLAGAMSILATIPIFVAITFFQRYLVRGLSMGAVKG